MRKMKKIMAFLTAMTMTIGAVGFIAYAEEQDSDSSHLYHHPVDVNEEFEGIRGDLDSDGQITMHDANLLARYLRDNVTEKLTAAADYDMDGYVNVRDAAKMVKEIRTKNPSISKPFAYLA